MPVHPERWECECLRTHEHTSAGRTDSPQLWIDHPAFPVPGHAFMGYYFTYPSEEQLMGLVSTIADDPPMLNWIYADKDGSMVRHGGRQATVGHTIGPWYWSDDEQWLTLEGNAFQFVAVQLENKKWAVAWDKDGRFSAGGIVMSETESETEGSGDQGSARRERPRKWIPVMLRRKMQLGMESRYVKGANG